MDLETMKWLDPRFSKLLSYSYAGFLVVVLGAALNPPAFSKLREATSWELMAIAAIVVGAGVYSFHRTLLVPVHHLLSSCLWCLLEIRQPKDETLIPTRWLGTLDPPVPFFWQISAYSELRHGNTFKEMQSRWDLLSPA